MIFHMDYYFMLMINICQVNALTQVMSRGLCEITLD